MTSRISARSPREGRGFTLIEILTVIGILAVLLGILIPVIGNARRNARRATIQASLQTIATALEAYRGDHGDYPRPAAGASGATTLCQALIAPQGETADGSDGPGFRLRGAQGKVYGPYLNPGTFPMADPMDSSTDFTTHAPANLALMPRGDHMIRAGGGGGKPYWSPILYYPARPGKPNIRIANGYVADAPTALYNAGDNDVLFTRNNEASSADALVRMRYLMGDTSGNGGIDAGETARFEGPFILWHPGFDGAYGPFAASAGNSTFLDQDDINKMDDVTNFYP